MFKIFFGSPVRGLTTTSSVLTISAYVESKLSPSNRAIVDNFNTQAEGYKKRH